MAKKKTYPEEVIENSQELDDLINEHTVVIPTGTQYEVIKAFKADLYGVKYDCQPGDVVELDDLCYRKLKDNLK